MKSEIKVKSLKSSCVIVFYFLAIGPFPTTRDTGGGGNSTVVSISPFKLAIQVRARHNLLVSERWNSKVLLTFSKAIQLLSCLCDNTCKRSLATCRKSRHHVQLPGFCLSLYGLHVLNRDVNMIKKKPKETQNCLLKESCSALMDYFLPSRTLKYLLCWTYGHKAISSSSLFSSIILWYSLR